VAAGEHSNEVLAGGKDKAESRETIEEVAGRHPRSNTNLEGEEKIRKEDDVGKKRDGLKKSINVGGRDRASAMANQGQQSKRIQSA